MSTRDTSEIDDTTEITQPQVAVDDHSSFEAAYEKRRTAARVWRQALMLLLGAYDKTRRAIGYPAGTRTTRTPSLRPSTPANDR